MKRKEKWRENRREGEKTEERSIKRDEGGKLFHSLQHFEDRKFILPGSQRNSGESHGWLTYIMTLGGMFSDRKIQDLGIAAR